MQSVLRIGPIELADDAKRVTVDGEEVALTPREYDILHFLMKNAGTVYSPGEIYRAMWKEEPLGADNVIAVHIRHIRDNQPFYRAFFKLCPDGNLRIMGYDEKAAVSRFGNRNIAYHIEFFGNGLNGVIKMWLNGGCRETPEEMTEIIRSEYGR